MKVSPAIGRPWLILALLLTVAFGLSASIEPWFQSWAGSRTESANILDVALGDSRRLFARHVYTKADAYFHSGYYPSMFDYNQQLQGDRLGRQIGLEAATDEHCAEFLGPSHDWIDRFSRHFYPSRHVHLGEDLSHSDHPHEETHHDTPDLDHAHHADSGADHHDHSAHSHGDAHDHDHEAEAEHGGREAQLEREVLPWLRFSASLDPNKVETYVIASYWLRTELDKPEQAERFLREGLRANPGNPEILFELGRIYSEVRHDPARARNVWELGLKHLIEQTTETTDSDRFLYAQFLGHLGRLEEEQGNLARAIEILTRLLEVSPRRESIESWIAEIKARQAG